METCHIGEYDISMLDPLESTPNHQQTTFKCNYAPRSVRQGQIEVSIESIPRQRRVLGELNTNIVYTDIPKSKSSDFEPNVRKIQVGRFLITRTPCKDTLLESLGLESNVPQISVSVTVEKKTPNRAGTPDILDLFY